MLFFINTQSTACDIVCPVYNETDFENENIFNNISGLNFLSKKFIEVIIQNELKKELNSEIKAKLDIYNIKSLKRGIFKSLTLTSQNLRYRALSLSNFNAETICEYNKVLYLNNKLKYPEDIPFKYSAQITNEDIQNIINSEEFQKELKRNEKDLFQVKTPVVEIKEGKIHFTIPIKTLLGSFRIKFKTSLKVENNKLVLTNNTFNTKSNIINDSMLKELLEDINPIEYLTSAINGKYYKLQIDKAETDSDRINIEGIFTINQNYGGVNE